MKKTMTLTTDKQNPLHVNQLNSPIIALGNGQVEDPKAKVIVPRNHGYNGDVWPILDDCDFYVLTSHTLTPGETAKYCGPSANLAECDAFLDQLIGEKGVFYWIFAVNRAMLPVVPAANKKTKPLPIPEEHEEQEDDDQEKLVQEAEQQEDMEEDE